MDKQKILIIVFAILVSSSALLLYRGFSSEPLAIVRPTVNPGDVIVKSQVDAVKVKINKAINKIDTGGSLDSLIQSEQFQQLMVEVTTTPMTVGSYGRANPFVPPATSTSTSTERLETDGR